MITKKGWASQLMLSLFTKEASYNEGVTMDASNACSMKGYESVMEPDDNVQNDKDSVTGAEYGTDSEIVSNGVKLSYKETRAKPNSVAGIAALCHGSITSDQDGVLTA